jgi:hypothetical protein
MAWQQKAAKMSMGKFARPKKDQMVLIQFNGEPEETIGKNFKKEEVDELRFPVKFWEIRPVSQKYEAGEASRIVMAVEPEDKILPVQGGPLLKCIVDEDSVESVQGKVFILRHTGEGTNTTYKLIEVVVRKQARIEENEEDDDLPKKARPFPPWRNEIVNKTAKKGMEIEGITEEKDPNDTPDHTGPNPKRNLPTPTPEEQDKAKFKAAVKKRAKKVKAEEQCVEPEME